MIRALPIRPVLLAAALLAALAIVIFGSPGDAGAQTSTTLIKNTSQSTVPLVEGLDFFDFAQRFRTGGAPHGYVVTSVGLPFRAVADASVAYTVSIHRLVGGGTSPGTRVGQLTRPGSLAANSVNTWTGPGIYLAPNTDYFVVIDSSSGAVNQPSQTASDNEDAGGASGWSIDNGGRFRGRSSSGTWGTSANSLQLQIGGYARAATPLVGTVLQPNQGDYSLGTHDRAQSFRTGADTNGYMLHGVGLFVSDVTNASVSYEVTITTAFTSAFGNLRPNTVLATLTAPASLTADSLNVWRSARGVYLAPNTDYFVLVDSNSAANNYLEITQSDAEDGGGHTGWSVGNDLIDRNRVGGAWSDDGIFSLKLQLSGYARASSGTSPPTTPVVNSDPASPTTLSVSWRAPDHAVNLPITSYDVQYRVQGSTAAWTSGPQDRTTTAASLTGLTEGTAYEVQVRATGSEGDSAWSASGYATAGATASAFVVGNTLRANEFVTNPIVSTHDVFQPFTTGSRADGYRITSVDLLFLHVADQGVSPPNVGIYVDRGSGLPGDRVGALFTRPARLVGANDGVNTWTSPGIDLDPSTTYLLGVIGAGSAAHIVRNSRSVNEDPGGLEGWTLGDSQNWRTRGTSSYAPIAKSLKMRLSGHVVGDSQPDASKLITNTGQPAGAFVYLSTQDVAQSFRTGGNADGYTLTSVTLEFIQVVDSSVSYPVAIYTDDGTGRPNQLVARLNAPASLNQFSVSRKNTWTSPGIYLAPNTDYVVFLDLSGGPDNRLATTGSDNEDAGGAAGWSIGNSLVRRNHSSTGFFFAEANSLRLEIAGFARDTSTPLPPTTPLVNSNPDSPTTLTATWRRPDVPVNLNPTYDLRYRVRGATTWSQGPQDRTTTSGTITGLTRGTTYEVQVRASDGQGDSVWTASGYGTAGGTASAFVIANTAQANEFSDNTNLLTHDVFQPFTTGPSHEGYRITNLEIMFLHVEAGRRGTVPNIAIFEERSPPGSGLPGTQVGIFTRPVRVVAGNDGVNTWTSPGIDLDPSTTYLLGVVSTGNAPHILRNTTSASADGGASPGWSIVFGHNKRPVGTSTYPPVFKSLKMRVYGYAERGNPPVFAQRGYSRTVDENSAGGVNVGDPITATDADGDTLTYSLGGTDAASFNVNAATGQITTKAGVTYDHEGKNTFRLTITATDGITPVSANVSIALNNINEPGDNPCGPDPIEARTFADWTVVDEEPPGVYRGTLQAKCYNGGHRTNTRYHLYEFTLAGQTDVMLVLESDLWEHRTIVDRGTRIIDPVTGLSRSGERVQYSYSELFDPYLILLRNNGDARTVVAEHDDIEHISGTSHVKHATAAIIRTLAAGTYTVYATSYSQGASGSFRLFYFHEESDGDPALVFPERRAELGEYTDYSFIKRRFSKEYGDEHAPMDVAVSDTGLVTWEINSELLQDGESFGVKWWVRTAPAGDKYRNAEVRSEDYQLVNVSACSSDDCSFQIPDFDPAFHYPVEVDLSDWYYSPRVPAAYTPSWRVRISETGEVSWTADSDPPDGQNYWVRWQSGETAPNYVEFDFSQRLFGYTQVDHDSSSCGEDGVCRLQIPDFDAELQWLAEVWPQRNNPTVIRWPGRWPAPEGADEPEAPALSGLSAVEIDADGTLLDVSWTAFENADKYLVQWKTGSDDYNDGQETTGTSYRITGLTLGTTYTVQVNAIDTDEDPGETLASSDVQGATWSDALRFGAATYRFSIAENTGAGANVGAPLTTLGAARGATVTHSLTGDDAASFAIDANSGQITTRSGIAYDYETKSSYAVTANGTDGDTTATATVAITLTDVEEPPDAPGAPDVSSVSATSLAVSWASPDNSGRPAITDYDVQYRAGDSGAWSSWTHDGVATSATITGLTTGSEYQVQVRATNADGSSPWSATGSSVPGTLVRNLGQAHGPSDRVSHLAFDTAQSFTTGSAEHGYTVTGVEIGYADAAATNVSPSVAIYTNVSGQPGTLVGTLIAAGPLRAQSVNRWTHAGLDLAKDTTYFVIIDSAEVSNWVAYTSSDDEDSGASAGWTIGNEGAIRAQASTGSWTPFSGSLRIDIRGAAKAGPHLRRGFSQAPGMDNLSVRPISGQVSKLYANWDPVTGATYYKVRWKTGTGAYGDASVTATAGFQIDGLDSNTSYTVEVQAMDTDADPHRTLARGETTATTLPAMGAVTVTPVADTTDSLDVSWNAVTLAAGYKVEWKTAGDEYSTVTRSDVTATTERITGLIPGTTYTVRVTARHDIDGTVADGDSAEGSATTSGDPPVTFVIYHDPNAGGVAVNHYNLAVALLSGAGLSYSEVKGDIQEDVDRLAGVTGSVLPRFFLGDPTDDDWTSEPRTNNGGLRWLRAKVAELQAGAAKEPAALTGLGVLASPGKTTELLASWSAFEGAEQYRVEQKVGTDPATAFVASSAGTTTSRNAFVTGLLAGTTYTIRVTAIDTDADPHADLAVAKATGTTLPVMGTVTVAPVASSDDSLDVSWKAVTGAVAYVVEYKAGTDSYTSVTRSDDTATTERITGLEAETAYTVRVTARHVIVGSTVANGDSAQGSATTNAEEQDSPPTGTPSQPPAANTPATGAPTVSGTAQVGQELTVDTSGISDADGLTGASYTYQWLADGAALSGATGSGYTPVAADVGKAISVKVSFSDDDGNAEELTSAATAAVVAEDPPPGPAALDGLAVSPVAGKTTELAVSWTAFSGADKYLVQWKTGSDDFNTGDESTSATHTITGLLAGTTYTIRVTAIDTDADPADDLATGEADGTTLAAMGAVAVEAVSDTADSLDVSWDAVTGATAYVVEYKTSGGSYTSVTRSDDTSTTERITGLDAETEYTVRVTARHTIGGTAADGDSAQGSATTNAPPAETKTTETTDEAAPALKAVFTVIGTGTSYAWDAMDAVGGNAVTHYSIEWATSLDGTWTTLDAPGEGRRCVPRMAAQDEGNGCYFEYEAAVSPSGITVGDTYYLRLVAHAGTVSSAPGAVLEDVLN